VACAGAASAPAKTSAVSAAHHPPAMSPILPDALYEPIRL
jgi:hypothetical protein